MQLKTVEIDGKTYAEVQDGKPVYDDGGKDIAFDAPGTKSTISRLNAEAKGHREAKEAAEAIIATFEGIEDPAAARKALETVAGLDQKKLIEAGEKDAAIAAAVKPLQEKLAAAEAKIGETEGALSKEMIGNRFTSSKWVADNLTPAGQDLLRTMYGGRLKVEGGAVVPYDAHGQKMFSEGRPGETASFDEAVQAFVNEYPHKDHILRGRGSQGTGANGSEGSGAKGKTITRAAFSEIQKSDPSRAMKMMTEGTVTITD